MTIDTLIRNSYDTTENIKELIHEFLMWYMLEDTTAQTNLIRLAPVLKTVFHQCVVSYTCSQSNSECSVLKQSCQS